MRPPLIFLVYSNFVKLLKKFCIYPADLSAADRADLMRQNICIPRILYPLTWDFSTCQTEKFSEFFRFFCKGLTVKKWFLSKRTSCCKTGV